MLIVKCASDVVMRMLMLTFTTPGHTDLHSSTCAPLHEVGESSLSVRAQLSPTLHFHEHGMCAAGHVVVLLVSAPQLQQHLELASCDVSLSPPGVARYSTRSGNPCEKVQARVQRVHNTLYNCSTKLRTTFQVAPEATPISTPPSPMMSRIIAQFTPRAAQPCGTCIAAVLRPLGTACSLGCYGEGVEERQLAQKTCRLGGSALHGDAAEGRTAHRGRLIRKWGTYCHRALPTTRCAQTQQPVV